MTGETLSQPELAVQIKEKATQVEKALDQLLPPEREEPVVLHQAMRYSVMGGGKRLRPILVIAAAECLGGSADEVMEAACAVELVHTYSLIHDDLPCMDDDDYRRGRPTNHRVFGEAVALLAGDALLTLAFELLGSLESRIDPGRAMRVVTEIARAAGTRGMIGGQVADLQSEGKIVGVDEIESIHRRKTGCLFRACLRSGAILTGAGDEALKALDEFAAGFGLAFQIIDDILDVVGDPAKLGKVPGSDRRKEKATYPAILGIEKSRALAVKAIGAAREALEPFGARGRVLRALADFVLLRES